jgi:hypothetical protein
VTDGPAEMMHLLASRTERRRGGWARSPLTALAAGLMLPLSATAQQVFTVDLRLVLCVDVSSSMSESEQRLQRAGYVSALHDPEVLRSIETGPRGRIAIAYLEWAGRDDQRLVMPWTILDEPQDAAAFATALLAQPYQRGRGTSISGALLASSNLLAEGPPSDRQVIDVSGDGPNNAGLALQPVHDMLVDGDVTINGLAISLHAPDTVDSFGPHYVELYYESCVIGGPDAFIVSVDDPTEFARAIRKKLVNEIAGLPATVQHVASRVRSRFEIDCVTIGVLPGR